VVCGLAADSDSVHQADRCFGHATSLVWVQQSLSMTNSFMFWHIVLGKAAIDLCIKNSASFTDAWTAWWWWHHMGTFIVVVAHPLKEKKKKKLRKQQNFLEEKSLAVLSVKANSIPLY